MRLLRTLVAALALAALSASAAPLRVIAPAEGTTLRGGTIAFVEWRATKLPEDTEEWEAFLSIDGGRYYGIRLTPHLDIAIHRFSFVVPNLGTQNARLMIRTGNEIEETHFESAGTFTIVRDATIGIEGPRLHEGGREAEAAREGDPDVVEWTEGSRDGTEVRSRSTSTPPADRIARIEREPADPEPILTPADVSLGAPTPSALRLSQPLPRAVTATLPCSRNLLLVCRRLNI